MLSKMVKDTDESAQSNENLREDIAKIFISLTTDQKQRGKIVQAGGIKVFLLHSVIIIF
jgi:hypothetical protein